MQKFRIFSFRNQTWFLSEINHPVQWQTIQLHIKIIESIKLTRNPNVINTSLKTNTLNFPSSTWLPVLIRYYTSFVWKSNMYCVNSFKNIKRKEVLLWTARTLSGTFKLFFIRVLILNTSWVASLFLRQVFLDDLTFYPFLEPRLPRRKKV